MRTKVRLGLCLLGALGVVVLLSAGTSPDTLRGRLESHVYCLASDSLEGRFVGTPGIEKAGRYIARQFEEIGLEPAFDGSYFQEFRIEVGFELLSPPVLMLGQRSLSYGSDFTVLPFSGSGEVESIFAARADPDSNGGGVACVVVDTVTADKRWTMTGQDGLLEWMRSSAASAGENGAAAVVFVSGDPEHPFARLHNFKIPITYTPLKIPVLEMTFASLVRVLGSRDFNLAMPRMPGTDRIESLEISPPTRCSIAVAAGPGSVEVANVGGILKGTGPEYIVIGAHYDHLGYGYIASSQPWRREVHPGADDNASGVAGVIEIARILSSRGRPERSIVFLAFTAEELGALGSEHYCQETPYPIDSTAAMINLDCIGRLKGGTLIAFGARSAEELGGLLEGAAAGHELNIVEKQEIYGFSDQNAFYARGVPALHFFTGAHMDYHSPDDVPAKINYDGAAAVTSYVADLAGLLAFNPVQLTPVIIQPETGVQPSRGEGAHLGIVPDFAFAGTGVGITGTVPGSPAEQAGLKEGDVIVGMNGRPIPDLKGLMVFLSECSPGDTVRINILRASVGESLHAVLSVRSPKAASD